MKWNLLIATAVLFYAQIRGCSEEADDEFVEDFVGLGPREGAGASGGGGRSHLGSDDSGFTGETFSTSNNAASNSLSSSSRSYFDEILMDEVVSISLNCEKSLGSSEDSLKSFVMKSLDFTAEETLADLERPACRAFFDRNGHQLSKEQLGELMASERGKKILVEGEVLEFFSDFTDFTLNDFAKFPSLKVAKIRDVSSISAEILLKLVKQGGFHNAGRLERIPEHFGERVLEHEAWKLDPEIWQLFTLEGIYQIHSIQNVDKFAKFLADRSKFENLLFLVESGNGQDEVTEFDINNPDNDNDNDNDNAMTLTVTANSNSNASPPVTDSATLRNRLRSSTITSDTSIRSTAASTAATSTSICKSIARNAPLLARWAIQSEELALYMMEMPEVVRGGTSQLSLIQEGVSELMRTRSWLKNQLKNRCTGAAGITENELLHLGNLKVLLDSPLAWRLKEALRLQQMNPHPDPQLAPPSQMTQHLKSRLGHFPSVVDFYRPMYTPVFSIVPNDHLLTHFFLVNEIEDLELIFGDSEAVDIAAANEKLVLSVAIRRILLLLLSPSFDASNVIQDALNYVFSSQSPLLATSDSNEILRWFRQAQDLQAIPVLDRLIRNFGHEFDVSREIRSVLSDRTVRMKLFTEAQSNLVKLIACLSNGLSEHLITDAPRILVSPYVDPANALLLKPVPALPVHPKRRPYTEEEIAAHAAEVERVRANNAAINEILQTTLRFLKTFSVSPQDGQLSVNFAGFIQPNFRIQFSDNVGIDAGGLRRTWLSSVLRIFGDTQRMLFPMHVYGGRTPAALLDPEIMGHLGALHGKALQVGVKPDWFFTARYSHEILFSHQTPEPDDLLALTEELFHEIFERFDAISAMEEARAVEYFNNSDFPTIEGLNGVENPDGHNENEADGHDENPDGHDENEVEPNENPNEHTENPDEPNDNQADNQETLQPPDNQEILQPPDNQEILQSPEITLIQPFDSDNDSVGTVDSVTQDIIHELNSSIVPTVHPIQTADPEQEATATNVHNPVLRHSFSRMLVFDVRFLSQESIYSGPRVEAQTLQDIQNYKSALLQLFAQNLLAGRHAYRNSFILFFDGQYRSILEPAFLHELLEPPLVTIEQVLQRIQFHKSCDEIFIIDDESEESEESEKSKESQESGESQESQESQESGESNVIVDESKITRRRPQSSSSSKDETPQKKSKTPLPNITNITSRTALIRILQSLFLDQAAIRSLLSFSTGCPQLPPAGLDALRLSVHCYATGAKMSKSHTCTNTIDFYASVGYKETKEAFKESVLSSTGFGFD